MTKLTALIVKQNPLCKSHSDTLGSCANMKVPGTVKKIPNRYKPSRFKMLSKTRPHRLNSY